MPPPPSGPADEERLTDRWFAAVRRARTASTWLRMAAWLFGVLSVVGLVGVFATLAGSPEATVNTIISTATAAVMAALFSSGSALLDVHAARLELAIIHSGVGDE